MTAQPKTPQDYLENLFRRIQDEYLAAVKTERENQGAAYFWGFKEGLALAQNIAFAHIQQLHQTQQKEVQP
jgi:hypothetical protein